MILLLPPEPPILVFPAGLDWVMVAPLLLVLVVRVMVIRCFAILGHPLLNVLGILAGLVDVVALAFAGVLLDCDGFRHSRELTLICDEDTTDENIAHKADGEQDTKPTVGALLVLNHGEENAVEANALVKSIITLAEIAKVIVDVRHINHPPS